MKIPVLWKTPVHIIENLYFPCFDFFFGASFFFRVRSKAVYVHDVLMGWSRFVLISLLASRFPADHRTKSDWLRAGPAKKLPER